MELTKCFLLNEVAIINEMVRALIFQGKIKILYILDPKTSIDIKIESKEAYICTLDECNDKVVGGSGFQNVLNILALMPLLFMI